MVARNRGDAHARRRRALERLKTALARARGQLGYMDREDLDTIQVDNGRTFTREGVQIRIQNLIRHIEETRAKL